MTTQLNELIQSVSQALNIPVTVLESELSEHIAGWREKPKHRLTAASLQCWIKNGNPPWELGYQALSILDELQAQTNTSTRH